MKRSIVGVAFLLSLVVSPLAHADSIAAPLQDPLTDVLKLWSGIASEVQSVAQEVAVAFEGKGVATSGQPASSAIAVNAFEVPQATSSSSAPQQPTAATTTVINYITSPIERVVDEEPRAPASFVTQSELAGSLASLSTSLLAEFAATVTPPLPQYVASDGNPNVPYAAANNIGQLSNVTISNPTISGGSIPASSITGTITNAINTAAGEIDSLTGTGLTYVAATTADATSSNLYASNLSAGTLIASGTTTLSLLDLSSLNCSTYGNGGKLTTDANGTVVCAADQGGSGSTVGGSDTQVQFNSGGSFAGSSAFTFASSTGLLTLANASTTNLTASYASSTDFIAGNVSVTDFVATNGSTTNATSTSLFASLANVTTGIVAALSGNQLTYTAASTTNISVSGEGYFTTASTTDLIVSNAPSGLLQTNAQGVVSATTTLSASSLYGTLGIGNGGTGTSTAPSYGQLLVGNDVGGYSLLATSSLGISGGDANSFGYLFPNNATTTSLLLLASTTLGNGGSNGLTVNGNSTTTGTAVFSGVVTLNGATTSAANGFNITAGCFSINGACIGSDPGTRYVSTSSQNTWSALQLLAGGASTTNLSVFTNAFFGGAATSSFNSFGQLTLAGISNSLLAVNGSGQVVGTSSVGVNNLTGVLPVVNGGTGSSTLSGILLGNGTSQVQSLTVGSGLVLSGGTLSTSGAGITALGPIGQTQTGGTQILATTTGSFNGLTAGLTIFGSGNTQTFTPTLSGTLNNAGLTHSSITINGTTFNLGDTNTITAASSTLLADSNTFSGNDTFDNAITGNISGNAGTATALQNARTINGVSFNGTANIVITAASSTSLADNNGWTGLQSFSSATSTLLSAGTLWDTGLSNALLGVNASGEIVATSSIGTNLLSGSLGTINGTPFGAGGSITVGSASTTLLADSNSFSGIDSFTNASSNFAGTWQGLSPSGFATFSYPFPSNATSTALTFTAGLLSLASTTVGNGSQVGGLTINGGATTTGKLLVQGSLSAQGAAFTGSSGTTTIASGQGFAVGGSQFVVQQGSGNVGIGTSTPGSIFSVNGILNLTSATSTFYSTGGINLTSGCYSINGTCVGGSLAGTTGQLPYFSGTNVQSATSTLFLSSAGLFGIGTTSPSSLLSLAGSSAIFASSTATSTFQGGGINLVSAAGNTGCFAVNGTCLPSQVSQLLNTYTVNASSSNISAGDIVSYINGQAEKALTGAGAATLLESHLGQYESAAALSSTSFVVAYEDINNGDYLTAIVCTVSGTSLSCGTPVALNSVASQYVSVAALSSTSFVVAYEGTSNYADAVVSTVSGTTITAGTPAALNVGNSSHESVAALSSTSFVVAYEGTSNYADAVVSTVSGTTITAGTPVALNSVGSSYESVAALSSTSFVVAYQGTSNYADAVGSTVSGTTITAGTPVALNSVNSTYESVVALSSTSFVVAYESTSGPSATIAPSTTIPISNTLGMAIDAATPGGSVTVASNGIVTGLSGLTAGSTYYWSVFSGLSTTPSSGAYKVGIALSSTSMLLNSNNGATADEFFGDAVFANDFRITEAPGSPEGLIFENQLNRPIASIDENGNWAVQGLLSAQGIASTTLQNLLATSTTQTTGYDFVGNLMQTVGERLQTLDLFGTAASSTTPVDQFANDLLQSLLRQITQWFASTQNGINQFFAQVGNFQQVCLTQSSGQKVCVTGDQLATLLSQSAGANASISVSSSSSSDLANSANANTANSTATNTAPIIQINGDNPAIVQVGATYNDLGATIAGPQADLNLGIQTFVNGSAMSPVQIDTSQAATDTIDYVVTDQNGLTSTSTRTVIVEAPSIAPSDDASSTVASSTASSAANTSATSTVQ